MTSANRPTLDPAKGRLAPDTGIVYEKALPSHNKLKYRTNQKEGRRPLDLDTEVTTPVKHEQLQNTPVRVKDFTEAQEADVIDDTERPVEHTFRDQDAGRQKKRSWQSETPFSGPTTTTNEEYHVNDSLRDSKNKKFLHKYVQ